MFKNKNKETSYEIRIVILLLFLVAAIVCITPKEAKAATAVSVKEINYLNSTITLQVNDGDTMVYFSDSGKKNWEAIPGNIINNTITMDISWISVSKNHVITFKGNHSTSILSVTIPKQVTNFKATYNKTKRTVTFSNAGSRTIEWRKKGSTLWNTVDLNTISSEISYLCNNGAVVYFRLAPVNGSGSASTGSRASKEVSVTIPKRTAAPSITIDGSRFIIPVKKNMAYRFVNTDGTASDWITMNSAANLYLKDIAAKALYTDAAVSQEEVTLQFKMNATSSAQESRVATVTVPVQEGTPDEDIYGISLSYASSSTVSLQVKAASQAVPFEYAIVKEKDILDYMTAGWTAITSSTAVNLEKSKAPAGAHVYVRKKSVAASATTDFSLASPEYDVSGTNGLTYPNAPEATTLTTLITTAGVCRTTDSSSYLTFHLYSATSTTVSSISLLNQYGIVQGTIASRSTVTRNVSSTGAHDQYIITTKITSTESVDTITEELLYAKITLANSDIITSNDTAGVRLYLYPDTVINNPEDADDAEDYTDNFKRIYLSDEEEDDSSFKFRLDLGTRYIPDTSTVNSFTAEPLAVSSIKYDGYTLVKDTDYTVAYGTYVNDEDETVATATVTVNVKQFEASSAINTTDTSLPLVIRLNNGEVLNNDIHMTLIKTAALKDAPLAWSITEGSLKLTKTSTVTNEDGSTTSVTEEVITYTLTLDIFDRSYAVSVSDVTWGGTSIFGSASISNGTATVHLSNAKINKLTTDSSDTKNVVITLSNGYAITTGCKLTILDASE